MSWYMAVCTDFDEGGYRPGWDDGVHVGETPDATMRDADKSRVYLMWHMTDAPQPSSRSLIGRQIPDVAKDDLRMVIKDAMGRILMLDGLHEDELVFSKPDRISNANV